MPDIISLILGITRHLKQLYSGEADHTDYSPIKFLLLALSPSLFVHSFLSVPHTRANITCMDRCALSGQGTFCCVRQSQNKAVTEHIYFWALNGAAPILLLSRSFGKLFTCIKPRHSTSFWISPLCNFDKTLN